MSTWATCAEGHVCCAGGAEHPAGFGGHLRPEDTCGDCAAMKDTLVASVEDECPTCGAYMLNPALHESWHHNLSDRLRAISEKAGRYVSPPVYGGFG